MFKLFISLFLVAVVVSANEVKFQDCGHGEVKKVMVAGCDTTQCIIHRGKPLEVQVEFIANENSKTALINMKATVNGVQVDVPGIDTNACHHLPCPLVNGKQYTFKYSWDVPKILPKANDVAVEAKLIGDGTKVLACGKTTGAKIDD